MNKFGFYIQMPGAGLDLIEKYKPTASLLMDIKSEHVAKAKQLSPKTEIIFRKEDGKKWRDKDPVKWAQAMWADVRECPPNFVVADNEPLGHGAGSEFADLDRWQRAYADWIHANTPMRVGMFSFPEGNFTKDGPIIPDHFPLSMKAADAVFIHEYWKPHLLSPGMEGYHCLRWDAWLKWFEKAGYPNMPIYITECGITMAVGGGPDVGYASNEAKAAGVTTETYLADLEEYHHRCCLEPRIKAVLPFIWCPWPGQWGTFVPTSEMTDRIFSFDAPGPKPEPEPPPNGGSEMFPRVLDINNKELFGEVAKDLVRKHGLTIKYPILQSGDKFLDLVLLDEREGPACFIFTVLKEDGQPWVGAETAWGWTNMGAESDDIKSNKYLTDWHERADLGPANENGNTGPGFGQTGWYHGEYEPGPGRAWIRHPQFWSVLLTGVGMMAGTSHRTMYGTWQLKTYQSEAPPPSGDPRAELLEIAERIKEIALGNFPEGMPTEMELTYQDGKKIKYTLAPATVQGAIASLWSAIWNR